MCRSLRSRTTLPILRHAEYIELVAIIGFSMSPHGFVVIGETALDVAKRLGHTSIVAALEVMAH